MPTTTMTALRDYMIALVKAIDPTLHRETEHLDFRPFENETEDFVDWAQQNAQAAFRMFQLRDTGERGEPDITNTDVAAESVTYELVAAYPHDLRAGDDGALDRDDVMYEDERLLGNAIGLHGYANFVGAGVPNASLQDEFITRVRGVGVDFLLIRLRYHFYRAR